VLPGCACKPVAGKLSTRRDRRKSRVWGSKRKPARREHHEIPFRRRIRITARRGVLFIPSVFYLRQSLVRVLRVVAACWGPPVDFNHAARLSWFAILFDSLTDGSRVYWGRTRTSSLQSTSLGRREFRDCARYPGVCRGVRRVGSWEEKRFTILGDLGGYAALAFLIAARGACAVQCQRNGARRQIFCWNAYAGGGRMIAALVHGFHRFGPF